MLAQRALFNSDAVAGQRQSGSWRIRLGSKDNEDRPDDSINERACRGLAKHARMVFRFEAASLQHELQRRVDGALGIGRKVVEVTPLPPWRQRLEGALEWSLPVPRYPWRW